MTYLLLLVILVAFYFDVASSIFSLQVTKTFVCLFGLCVCVFFFFFFVAGRQRY